MTDLKIPLTTKAEKEAAHPRPPACLCRPARPGKFDLGLSAALRKKIAKLGSLTMTMRATYTLGSDKPVSLGTETIKLDDKKTTDDRQSLENIRDFNEEDRDAGSDPNNLDG